MKKIRDKLKNKLQASDDLAENILDTLKNFLEKTLKIPVSKIESNIILKRKNNGRLLGGVCTGIGIYLNINPWILRMVFLVGNFLPGPGVMTYIVLWVILPHDGEHVNKK